MRAGTAEHAPPARIPSTTHPSAEEDQAMPRTPKHLDLYFPMTKVLEYTRAAAAATRHRAAVDGDARPALIWVKDSGIYLLSSALEPGRDYRTSTDHYVHARGWEAGTEHDPHVRATIGGDDFHEHMWLDDPWDPVPGMTFGQAVEAFAETTQWFLISATRTHYSREFIPHQPTGNRTD